MPTPDEPQADGGESPEVEVVPVYRVALAWARVLDYVAGAYGTLNDAPEFAPKCERTMAELTHTMRSICQRLRKLNRMENG